MAHRNKNLAENCINKTFSFKVKAEKEEINSKWIPAIKEYTAYYNRISDWICDRLTNTTVGELIGIIGYKTDKKGNALAYIKDGSSEKYRNLPLYCMFKKNFPATTADNIMYQVIEKLGVDKYNGNSLGLSGTYYRRIGYIANVIGNYRTKVRGMKASVKYRNFNPNDVTEDVLENQTIFEINKNGFECKGDFEKHIEYLKNRELTDRLNKLILRMECLYNYYVGHEDAVKAKMENYAIESFKTFGGCHRNSNRSMSIQFTNNSPLEIKKVGKTSFDLYMPINGEVACLQLMGNKQAVCVGENGERCDLVDIVNSHSKTITIKIINGEMYVDIPCVVNFEKKDEDTIKSVGIDVNIKHEILATSVIDNGQLNGYFNIYKELINNKEFVDTFNGDIKAFEAFKDNAAYVTFGLLEPDLLFTRFYERSGFEKDDRHIKLRERERILTDILKRIGQEHSDVDVRNYVRFVNMLRSKYESYFVLKNKYCEEMQEFDSTQNYVDASTASKETMDKRRFDNPFRNTEVANELLGKISNVLEDIKGCMANIITYAFKVLQKNGYNTIGLEYLDSSQFENMRTLTPTSILKYHKMEGKSADAVESWIKENKIPSNRYDFIYEDNHLTDVLLNSNGIAYQKKNLFMNLVIKAISFADIKNKFVQLSNNTNVSILFAPAAFTSQMDSNRHVIYTVKNNKGKLALVDKKRVRPNQEKHINGLHSGYNAACNVKFICDNEFFRNTMTISNKGKNLYSQPTYDIKEAYKKNAGCKVINDFIKNGNAVICCIENNKLIETNGRQ